MKDDDDLVCKDCGGKLVYKLLFQTGIRKPALKRKRTCVKCGYWPLAKQAIKTAKTAPVF